MIYLFNTNIENQKKVKTALINIYGIGKQVAQHICDQTGITEDIRINQLTNKQIEKLANYIGQKIIIGPELKQYKKKILID